MFEFSDWTIAVILFWLVCLLLCVGIYVVSSLYRDDYRKKSTDILL